MRESCYSRERKWWRGKEEDGDTREEVDSVIKDGGEFGFLCLI